MAKASLHIVLALRETARQLTSSNDYQWGHMGSCNCGFLAQQVSKFHKKEIHDFAMQRSGDWSEQLNDYCAASGMAMDTLITTLVDFGFDVDDLRHLERLSDKTILNTLAHRPKNNRPWPYAGKISQPGDFCYDARGVEFRGLRHNVKSDVIKYLNAWASLLEEKMMEEVNLPALAFSPAEA